MVVVSYFVTVIPTAFILGFIWTSIVLIGFSHSIADVQKVSNYFLIISFIALIVGVLGIRYGINYVAKKTKLTKSDILKIIIWFSLIQIIMFLFNISKSSVIFWQLFVLVINCGAVILFTRKLVK